jgi:hypothetical protein
VGFLSASKPASRRDDHRFCIPLRLAGVGLCYGAEGIPPLNA